MKTTLGAYITLGLILLTACGCSAVSFGASSVQPIWSLPLDIGTISPTGVSVVAADADTVYASDRRGTLFAVRPTDGHVLWSYDGRADLYRLQLYPEIPDMVYYVTVATQLTNFSVRAIRKSDGVHVGTVTNLTNSYTFPLGGDLPTLAPLRASGGGLVAFHTLGTNWGIIQGLDKTLNNVRWTVSNGIANNSINFNPDVDHIGANRDIVFTIEKRDWPYAGQLISIDSYTGKVLCNISNMTTTMQEDDTSVFLTKDNQTVLNHGGFFPIPGGGGDMTYVDNVSVVDVNTCALTPAPQTYRLKYVGVDSSQWLNHTYGDNNTEITLSFGNLNSFTPLWTKTLPFKRVGSGMQTLKITAGTTAFNPDALVLWWPGSDLIALNRTNGKTLWTVKKRIPIALPNGNDEFVFPLGDRKLFIPNLQGYIIVDVKTGTILADVEDAPGVSAFSFQGPGNVPIVVAVNLATGSLYALQ